MEIQFLYHKIYHFGMKFLWFGVFRAVHSVFRRSHHPKGNHVCIRQLSPFPLPQCHTHHLLLSVELPLLDISYQ